MKREDLQLYFIMGTGNVSQQEPLAVLEQALRAGITMFQLREKGPFALTGLAYEQFARQCQKRCQHYHVPFIINDDVDLAVRLGADGVHIGQDDEQIAIARKKWQTGSLAFLYIHRKNYKRLLTIMWTM